MENCLAYIELLFISTVRQLNVKEMIMGNIRQTYIKSAADALLRQYPNEFSADFNANKDKVSRLAKIQTKSVRNHIAGYVTTRMTMKGRKRY